MNSLTNALLISAIGMSLVFASIVVLWLVMALLMRLTAVREPAPPAAAESTPPAASAAHERRRRAALAAVAVALARQSIGPVPYAAPPTAVVSAWQSVMRGRQLKQRGPLR